MSILQKYIKSFVDGADLVPGDAASFLDVLISESDEALLGDVFRAWDQKGIAADEIFEVASVMRRRCKPVVSAHETFVDIVGTGGSRNKTFNVSTAAAFVVAGAGVPVAKHGNRAATSNSGSADVLSALGVEPAVDAATAEKCLKEIGICFMFAPNFHRLSPTLGKVRRSLGFPTIFNCVGPLCNPANAPYQLIGVWREDLVSKMADALARLGTKRSWIVYGGDGVDEVSLRAATAVAEVNDGVIRGMEITAGDFGIPDAGSEDLKVSSPEESADLIRGILSGKKKDTFAERILLCNAAAAIFISGKTETLSAGLGAAKESIKTGSALRKLTELAAATKT
ncbi:MAG TPA: anthranilate phosphoribosyltransferase [Pyrinomonadaceae bacterium]|nr:anthranilate phosphoribosyltransferase [Pyrinomonadaceae bacterium]